MKTLQRSSCDVILFCCTARVCERRSSGGRGTHRGDSKQEVRSLEFDVVSFCEKKPDDVAPAGNEPLEEASGGLRGRSAGLKKARRNGAYVIPVGTRHRMSKTLFRGHFSFRSINSGEPILVLSWTILALFQESRRFHHSLSLLSLAVDDFPSTESFHWLSAGSNSPTSPFIPDVPVSNENDCRNH